MWIEVTKVGILFLILEKKLCFSPLSMLAVCFSSIAFLCWGNFLLFVISRVVYFFLIMKGCWIFVNAFSASLEIIMWFLSFVLWVWCITLIDFSMSNHFCVLGIFPTWSWCMMLLKSAIRFGLLIFCRGFLYLYSSG